MLRMHLLPMLEEVVDFFGLSMQVLKEDLRGMIREAPDSMKQDEADSLAAADYAAFVSSTVEGLLSTTGKLKALLRMRLLQTKDEIYVEGGGF